MHHTSYFHFICINHQFGSHLNYYPNTYCGLFGSLKVCFLFKYYVLRLYFFIKGYGRDYRERLLRKWGIVDVNDCCSCARYLVAIFWHLFFLRFWRFWSILNNMLEDLYLILISLGWFRSSWCRTIMHYWGICWWLHYPRRSCFQRYIQGRSFLVWCECPVICLIVKDNYFKSVEHSS